MKSKEEILETMSDAMPWVLNKTILPYIKEAMDIYATEAIKADRERIAKRATIAVRVNVNGQHHPVINIESILNLPIELP